MRAPNAPPFVEVGATAGWVIGSCVVAFCAGFSATLLFELVVYDIPEIASWWDLDVLMGALAAWVTLMAQSAVRLRVDDVGLHRRSLLRRRTSPWSSISELAVRPPRTRLVSEVLSFRADERWHSTASGLNTHPGGARGLLELAAPHAQAADVAVTVPEDQP
ncbi:MAG: hypothetical protein OES57_18520 [Acidimicrobiia bacterium]|nr:hypothetical protein [Acidimicrobiia bacterium]